MTAAIVRRALDRAEERATIPAPHRLESATNAHTELEKLTRDGAAHSPRALAVAMRLLDLLQIERLQAAASIRAERATARAQTAGQARAAAADYDPRIVRAWAREHGYTVPARGRYLPEHIVTAWRQDGAT